MIIVRGRNVNHTYKTSVETIRSIGVRQESRNGPVLVAPHPVVTVTENPRERVLFDQKRDANPFFHFFECLWMISGSSDGRWLDTFVKNFSSRFAQPGGKIHGAYGERWRAWPNLFEQDGLMWPNTGVGEEGSTFCQLNTAVGLLRQDKNDRRVVIQMWDPCRDLGAEVRDVPCNLLMIPRIVDDKLDLSVVCRSNDIIWGATGANVVHFSFVQEWLASQIGVDVGKLYQFSNNWHAYIDTLEKVGEPQDPELTDVYRDNLVKPYRICGDAATWDRDMIRFMEGDYGSLRLSENPFLLDVCFPMRMTHTLWSNGQRKEALEYTKNIKASDWQLAAQNWMLRRMPK